MDTALRWDSTGFGTDARWHRWSELLSVAIRTTADGPYVEDVFFVFRFADGTLELPQSWVDTPALQAMQAALPGIDNMKIARAMGSAQARVFRIWHVDAARQPLDTPALRSRWEALLARLGAGGAPAPAFDRLLAAWRDEKRRYHGLEHLAECLAILDSADAEAGTADVVELALWWHDAVQGQDAEARSAAWMRSECQAIGVPAPIVDRADELIRATDHTRSPLRSDSAVALVRDCDLAILGSEPLRFLEYEYAIEEEYAPATLRFFAARGRFLAGLLDRPSIYSTLALQERFESKARENIGALLASPRYRAWRWISRWHSWRQAVRRRA